jgi:hypothetical protein
MFTEVNPLCFRALFLVNKLGFLEAAERQSNDHFPVGAQWPPLSLLLPETSQPTARQINTHSVLLRMSLVNGAGRSDCSQTPRVLKISTANQANVFHNNILIYSVIIKSLLT